MVEAVLNNPYLEYAAQLDTRNKKFRLQNEALDFDIRRKQGRSKLNEKKSKDNTEGIKRAKVQALQFFLRGLGLGVCDEFGCHLREDNLGIFPKKELRFLYRKEYHAQGYNASYEFYIETLCPEHFPHKPNTVLPSPFLKSMEDISSEVIEINGGFIRVLDEQDARFCRPGNWELEGREVPVRQGYNKAMFEKFGLPKPDYPDSLWSPSLTHYWYGSITDICLPVGELSNENVPCPPWLKYG